ncbi:MAG: alkaline phosphatase family protein, partial [Planctomycetes bacterium]|nr:alkaline phosphatase family protein [Planctomycetota bacterium]
DGMRPDGILHAETPNLDTLIAGGAYSFKARGVLPTSSSPNWASMINGAGPEQHGMTSNAWQLDHYSVKPTATGVSLGPDSPVCAERLKHRIKPSANPASDRMRTAPQYGGECRAGVTSIARPVHTGRRKTVRVYRRRRRSPGDDAGTGSSDPWRVRERTSADRTAELYRV